jgi:hypothetical protein
LSSQSLSLREVFSVFYCYDFLSHDLARLFSTFPKESAVVSLSESTSLIHHPFTFSPNKSNKFLSGAFPIVLKALPNLDDAVTRKSIISSLLPAFFLHPESAQRAAFAEASQSYNRCLLQPQLLPRMSNILRLRL